MKRNCLHSRLAVERLILDTAHFRRNPLNVLWPLNRNTHRRSASWPGSHNSKAVDRSPGDDSGVLRFHLGVQRLKPGTIKQLVLPRGYAGVGCNRGKRRRFRKRTTKHTHTYMHTCTDICTHTWLRQPRGRTLRALACQRGRGVFDAFSSLHVVGTVLGARDIHTAGQPTCSILATIASSGIPTSVIAPCVLPSGKA